MEPVPLPNLQRPMANLGPELDLRMARLPSALVVLVVLGLALLLQAFGGGGGNDCRQTGTVQFEYQGASLNTTTNIQSLPYALNRSNSWVLNIKGVNEACKAGLKVTVRSDSSLPSPVVINEATGELSTPVLQKHIEGICTLNGSYGANDGSVNRVCPPGRTLTDIRVVLMVSSDYISTGNPYPVGVVFVPQ